GGIENGLEPTSQTRGSLWLLWPDWLKDGDDCVAINLIDAQPMKAVAVAHVRFAEAANPQRIAHLLAVHGVPPLDLFPLHELGGVLLESRNVTQLLRLLLAQTLALPYWILAGGDELASLSGPLACTLKVRSGAITRAKPHDTARLRPLAHGG